jgi:hypothetical protein
MEKIAVHPASIFKQAWSVCWENLGKLGGIYLVINLPLALLSLSPMVKSCLDQKLIIPTALWFVLVFVASSWAQIALFLGANKAVDTQDYTVGQSINKAPGVLLKYIGTVLIPGILFLSIVVLSGIMIAIIVGALSQVHKILTVLICCVVVILVLVIVVYFSLRWSLAIAVCVLENVGPIVALKRSFSLTTEYMNPVTGTYGLTALVFIVGLILMIVPSGLLVGKDANLANHLTTAQVFVTIYMLIINIIMIPFVTTVTVVLYKKLKEALDTHVRA